ncbi:polysaccharide biosynthesis tyrosine autokinase [Maribellus comscasis]|uniref:non-specific protein-tyrosine kinase n=1 Tax=Maribellus comscasis TaxID=2681766 RepID=A0A6I6JUT1_9BACT|nr:polysaccharide biosynthesis tyrosine autokinase [Maribellus comscasis]QGY43912.1 polysaccharide biosynthesis tyrosine autokinase [Maribellus comscasis]
MERIDEVISLIDAHEKKQTRNLFLKYLKKWPWFVAVCLIFVAIGYFKYKNSPNIYQVGSRILIKGEETNLSNVLSFDNPIMNMGKKTNIENQLGILQSYTLYQKALKNLNWETSWYKKELLYNKELYKNEPFELVIPPTARNAEGVLIGIEPLNEKQYFVKIEGSTTMNGYGQEINIEQTMSFGEPFLNDFFNFTINSGYGKPEETYFLKFNNLNSLTQQYLAKTNIGLEDLNSDLIVISIAGANPRKEADFINELNNVFVQFGVQNKEKSSDNSMEFIDSQLERIQKSLKTSEDNFSDYRKNNQVMNLGQEAQVVYKRLEEIENEQYLTQLQYDYYSDLQQYLDDSKKIEEMVSPSVIGINDANLTKMLSDLMDLYGRREVLGMSVQEKNPTFIKLEREIKITRDGLEETLKNQLKATETKLESMQERFNSIQERLKKLPETEKQLVSIQREFDLNNDLYTYMLQKKAEASISKASIAPEVQIIDPARVEAAFHVGPSMVKNVGLGFFAGFFLTFGVITLIGFFNNKIETREEIEKGTKIPVLEGIIQHKYKVNLPVIHHPRSGIAESFRGVKSNLNAILEQPGAKVVSINSLIPGEGKSFISSNFSAILTKTNKKVLLIGADMHKPTLHNYLDLKEAPGLSNYLQGEKTFDEIVMPTSVPNLSVIQAGPVPPNPSDLIDGDKLERLIDRVRKIYDYIIFDNAPLLLVPDAIITSRFSDVSLFILRINHSHKDQIGQINKIVDFNKVQKAAIVINETPDRGYGYGNKYWKKGYGEYKGKMSIA